MRWAIDGHTTEVIQQTPSKCIWHLLLQTLYMIWHSDCSLYLTDYANNVGTYFTVSGKWCHCNCEAIKVVDHLKSFSVVASKAIPMTNCQLANNDQCYLQSKLSYIMPVTARVNTCRPNAANISIHWCTGPATDQTEADVPSIINCRIKFNIPPSL